MQTNQLKNILEAALLASPHPLSLPQLAAVFAEDEGIGHDQLASALDALREDCTGRGIELVEVASGFRYQVRQDVHPWVARMWTERPSRYSRALLETLALIAYRQPITRGEIEQIRGVAVSSNIIKTLEEREWVRVVGHRDVVGKPALFGTTRGFLDYFNLKSLDELPPLAEILDLEELNPQFQFDGEPAVPARIAAPDAERDATDAAADGTEPADGADDAGATAVATREDAATGAAGAEEAVASETVVPIVGEDVEGTALDDDTDINGDDISGDDIDADATRSETDTTAADAETTADADASARQDPKENRA